MCRPSVIGIADAAMVKECLRVLCDNAQVYPERQRERLKARGRLGEIAVTDTGSMDPGGRSGPYI